MQPETVIIEHKAGCVWLTLPSTITSENRDALQKAVLEALPAHEPQCVFDLSSVNRFFSTGFGLLIAAEQEVGKRSGNVALVNVSARCREQLESVHLTRLFPVFSTAVEFEISHEAVWEKRAASQSRTKFLCLSQIENAVNRISLAGSMMVGESIEQLKDIEVSSDIRSYLIDCTNLERIDSKGISELVVFLKKVNETGGRAMVFGMRPHILELLELLALNDMLRFYDDEQAAMAAICSEE